MSPAGKRPPRRRSPVRRSGSGRKAPRGPAISRSDLESLLEQLSATSGPDSAEARRLRRLLADALAASDDTRAGGGEAALAEGGAEGRWGKGEHASADDWDADDPDTSEWHEDEDGDEDEDGWYGGDWDPWAARRRAWAAPSQPIAVEGGLTARSRRGAIGETWWSQRFLAAIEAQLEGGRSTRGRAYARKGQVIDLAVAAGTIEAHVQGSRRTPYRVRLTMAAVPDEDWERIVAALASQAGHAARLLAGDLPHEIEDVFAAEGSSLFPSPTARLTTECTCPDWANPCKHVAAVCYLVAEAFDRDPFAVLAWRGRTRDQLLAAMRSQRPGETVAADGDAALASAALTAPGPMVGAGNEPVAGEPVGSEGGEPVAGEPLIAAPPLADCLAGFWKAGPALASVRVRPEATETPGAVLRHLPRGLLEVGGHDVGELLEPAFATLTAAAARRALGTEERPPRPPRPPRLGRRR